RSPDLDAPSDPVRVWREPVIRSDAQPPADESTRPDDRTPLRWTPVAQAHQGDEATASDGQIRVDSDPSIRGAVPLPRPAPDAPPGRGALSGAPASRRSRLRAGLSRRSYQLTALLVVGLMLAGLGVWLALRPSSAGSATVAPNTVGVLRAGQA